MSEVHAPAPHEFEVGQLALGRPPYGHVVGLAAGLRSAPNGEGAVSRVYASMPGPRLDEARPSFTHITCAPTTGAGTLLPWRCAPTSGGRSWAAAGGSPNATSAPGARMGISSVAVSS
jgi:hypothetical protein